jgi:sugar phosphate isomerase/epimerase
LRVTGAPGMLRASRLRPTSRPTLGYYLRVSATIARTLALAHLTVLDTTPPELVTVAAAAGFRTIGIRLTATPSVGVPPYDCLREGPMLRETLARLADTGVSVLDTEFLRFEPEHPVGIPEGFLEVSARLGAKHVLVMSAEPEDARTLERFGELCDRAAAYGLAVGLEFAVYTGVRTLAHAADVVARSKRANASIVIDALHFSRSGGLPAHVAAVDPALLRYAQICDGGPDMPAPTDTPALIREARTGRLLPGEGVLPLRALVAALPAGVPLAIEAPCRATADLPALERARRACRALTSLTGA